MNHPIDDRVPIERSPSAVEAWFAVAGLAVTVVEQCPVRACRICNGTLPNAA